jgi:hypothetical protein
MTSIFDLKTSVAELSSSNEGTARMEYDQHPPTRDITSNNFPNGAIHFRFQTSGQKWWVPSRSYLRLRCQLSKADGTQLTKADGIAPNMGLCSSLFQSMEFRINDKTISRVSDFVPQVDALETRLSKSRSWLKGIGASVNFWEEDYKVRQADVVSDGVLLEEQVDSTVQNPPVGRAAMGFDAAGGAAVERNQWGYVEATGLATYARGTDAAGLTAAQASAAYPVGSYFVYNAIQGAAATDARVGKAAKVVANDGAGVLTLQTGIIGADVATDGRNDFQKIVIQGQDEINKARKVQFFEMTWCPPLSIFKVGHALPSGKYELVLNPQTASVYQKYAIEALLGGGDKVPNIATPLAPSPGSNFIFNIVDMYMYVNTVEGPRVDDITYLLDLEQTRCQSESIDTTSFQQKNFDVSPSTYALTVAYQDLRAGTNAQVSSTKFKSYNAALTVSQELKLNRFFINYAGQNLPAPDADPEFSAVKDYTTQRYVESQIYSGAYFDTGGGEELDEYHERGSYYYFSWPRDGTDRSTRVNVHQQFNAADVVNMRVLLFDHAKQVARVRIQDGRIVDLQLEDA